MANQKEMYIREIIRLLEQCDAELLAGICKLNRILAGLSAAQMEYLIELSTLLFGQSPE